MTAMSLRIILILWSGIDINENYYGEETKNYLMDRFGKVYKMSIEYHNQIIWKIQSIMREM